MATDAVHGGRDVEALIRAAGTGTPARIEIELVWVAPDQLIGQRRFALPRGARVADALAALRADASAPEVCERLVRGELQLAIYGERCEPGATLDAGDRIELLAELRVDPKTARQRRVEKRRALEPRSKWRGNQGQ